MYPDCGRCGFPRSDHLEMVGPMHATLVFKYKGEPVFEHDFKQGDELLFCPTMFYVPKADNAQAIAVSDIQRL